MPGATIYDVARKAEVSISTVSRVLNSPSQVHEATRARVLAAIDALGFVPKAEAVDRARKGMRRIGVLAPFFTYPSFVQRLRGVDARLSESPYELVIYNIDSARRHEAYLSSLPFARRLDGLIVMALPPTQETLQWLINSELGAVLIECVHPNFSSVEIDDVEGGRMAASYLLEKGHRQFGFVGDATAPNYAIYPSHLRRCGFQQFLAQVGITLRDEYIALGPHSLEHARQQGHQLFSLPSPPTAVFAASDTQAMGVLRAAQDCGMRVPEDVAIIGFDDLDVAEYLGLTTIRQPLEESGRVAADLLLARLSEPERPTQRIKLPLTIIQRATA